MTYLVVMNDSAVAQEIKSSLLSREFSNKFGEIASKYGLTKREVMKMGYFILEKDILSDF